MSKEKEELKDEELKEAPETEDATENEDQTQADAPGEAPAEEGAETSKEDEDLQTKYLRLAADFQNFRRRTEKEKSEVYAFANEKFATSLLEVIDNFDRALAQGSSDEKFAEGMGLILKQLQDVLTKNNVAEIKAEGEPFDPNFHNAVMTEAAEGVESGNVVKVLQKGYTLNGKVIRAAMVTVAE